MQTIYNFAGSTDMWSTSVGGHLMKVVNLTGFTVYVKLLIVVAIQPCHWHLEIIFCKAAFSNTKI